MTDAEALEIIGDFEHEITGDRLDWWIAWDMPLGLELVAHVQFMSTEHIPESRNHLEAWGRPVCEVTPADFAAHGGTVLTVCVERKAEDGMGYPVAISDNAREAIVDVVTKEVERRGREEEV